MKKNIQKEIFHFSAMRYVTEAFYAIRGFLIAFFLKPSEFGLWSLFRIIVLLPQVLDFGVVHGMSREVPHLKGQKSAEKASALQKTVFAFSFWSALFYGVLLFIYSFTPFCHDSHIEFRLLSVCFFLYYLYFFFRLKVHSENRIHDLTVMQFLFGTVNVFLGIILLIFFKIIGLLISMILSCLAVFVYLYRKGDIRFSIQVDMDEIKSLAKIGFPIMLVSFFGFFLVRADSLIVYFLLGRESAGYYGLAAFIMMTFSYLPSSMVTVLFPKLMQDIGAGKARHEIQDYFTGPLTFIAYLVPICLGVVFLGVDFVILQFLPKYETAIIAIKILLVGIYFLSFVDICKSILIALNKQAKLTFLFVFVLIVGISLDFLAIYFGFGLMGIASATTLLFVLTATLFLIWVIKLLSFSVTKKIMLFLKLSIGFVWSCAAIFLLDNFISYEGTLSDTSLRLILFLGLTLPLVLFYFFSRKKESRGEL